MCMPVFNSLGPDSAPGLLVALEIVLVWIEVTQTIVSLASRLAL